MGGQQIKRKSEIIIDESDKITDIIVINYLKRL